MVYFLSDSHIGSRALPDWRAHERKVCAFLREIAADASAIYLLGDIFDFWYEYLWAKPKEYALTLDTLRSIVDSGVEVHYFIGNHDIWTFGWLEQRTGVTLHRHAEELIIGGQRFFLAHGDGLGPSDLETRYSPAIRKRIRHFMRLRRMFHNPLLQRLFSLVPPSWGNRFGYGWARRSRECELVAPCPYKGEHEEELVLFAKEHERTRHCDCYIFGHRHIELDLVLAGGARLLILGDMFRQYTYARMTLDGRITLENYE